MSTTVFGAPEFRARSGRTVTSRADGSVVFDHVNGYLGPEQVFDAEEFFQAKRDAELGRWRWPENPDYVVYPNPDEAFERMFGPNLDLVILRESDAMTKGYVRVEDLGGPPMDHRVGHILAARAYFEAHPEQKPWVDAKPGEVWVLSTADGETAAYSVMSVRESGIVFESHEGRYVLTDPDIESARRIWPEDAS